MDKKLNNKGFSLVEVIVVIAIIGILAVTMAPKLTQYIDKAKYASDHEVVNTIYTAVKLADISNPITEGSKGELGSKNDTSVYKISNGGKTWTLNKPNGSTSITISTGFSNEFIEEMMKTLDAFTLKAKDVQDITGGTTQIHIGKTSNGEIYVVLDYNGNKVIDGNDYKVPEHLTVTLSGT